MYLINIIINIINIILTLLFHFHYLQLTLSISALWKKKVVPKLRQEVKVKVDIVTSDDIKIYYTGKFQDFTARYIINMITRSVSYIAERHLDSL